MPDKDFTLLLRKRSEFEHLFSLLRKYTGRNILSGKYTDEINADLKILEDNFNLITIAIRQNNQIIEDIDNRIGFKKKSWLESKKNYEKRKEKYFGRFKDDAKFENRILRDLREEIGNQILFYRSTSENQANIIAQEDARPPPTPLIVGSSEPFDYQSAFSQRSQSEPKWRGFRYSTPEQIAEGVGARELEAARERYKNKIAKKTASDPDILSGLYYIGEDGYKTRRPYTPEELEQMAMEEERKEKKREEAEAERIAQYRAAPRPFNYQSPSNQLYGGGRSFRSLRKKTRRARRRGTSRRRSK